MVEEFKKTKNGPTYYSVYHRVSGVLISVVDIRANDKNDALERAKGFLTQAIEDMK